VYSAIPLFILHPKESKKELKAGDAVVLENISSWVASCATYTTLAIRDEPSEHSTSKVLRAENKATDGISKLILFGSHKPN